MPGEPEPRWLDAEEWAAWSTLGMMLMKVDHALDAQLRRDAGINHFEYLILAALSESPERTLRMSYLAALAGGSLSRLSQAVRRLERPGWVTRGPDPDDGRVTLATLTEDGHAKVVATAPGHVAEVRRIVFDQLTRAQVRQLAAIGRRVTSAFGPDELIGPFPPPR